MQASTQQQASSGLRRKLALLLSVTAFLATTLTVAAFGSLDPSALGRTNFWVVALVTTLCAQVLALLITALAHATLSMQLTGLAARVRKLRERQDFSRRVGPTRHRLLHELTSALDELLWTVEVRERELLRQRGELETLLAARSRELDKKSRDLRLLLDNVNQGALLLDSDSLPGAARSSTFDRWFGAPEPGQTFGKVIARAASDFDERFANLWKRMSEGFLPVELELLRLPSTFTSQSGRHYQVNYQLDGTNSGRIEQLLVLVTDITAQVEYERSEAERAQLGALIEHVGRDRMSFAANFHELDAAVQNLTCAPDNDGTLPLSALDALKTKFTGLRLSALAAHVQALENLACDETAKDLDHDDAAALGEAWERFATHARLLLGEGALALNESFPPHRVSSRF